MRTLVDTNHKTLRNLKKAIVDNDEILNIVNELGQEDRTIEDLKEDCPVKIEKLEEASLNYMGENDLELLKTEFPDKCKCLTKKNSIPI